MPRIPREEPFKVAFDFGGLFIASSRGKGIVDRSVMPTDRDIREMPTEGSFAGFKDVIDHLQSENVFFVKRCETVEEESYFWRWIAYHQLVDKTGFNTRNIIICQDRRLKAKVCLKHGIKMMIDDRYEVFDAFYRLGKKARNIKLIAFSPDPQEKARFPHLHNHVVDVYSWQEVLQVILEVHNHDIAAVLKKESAAKDEGESSKIKGLKEMTLDLSLTRFRKKPNT